jgi:hypothetical protein
MVERPARHATMSSPCLCFNCLYSVAMGGTAQLRAVRSSNLPYLHFNSSASCMVLCVFCARTGGCTIFTVEVQHSVESDHHVKNMQRETGINEKLWAAGLRDEQACAALTNPGFKETFPLSAPTLDHPSYRICGYPLMKGKLDWLLHRGGLTVVDSSLGNHEYTASDHKWLAADFSLPGTILRFSPAGSLRRTSDGSSKRQQGELNVRTDSKPPLSICA